MLRIVLLALLVTGASWAQEEALDRVKAEAMRLRQLPLDAPEIQRPAGLHSALKSWIESLLPQSKAALDAQFTSLPVRVNAALLRAGLSRSGDMDAKPGFVSRIEFSRPAEDTDKLVVIVGPDVPCGFNDAVYVYDYSSGISQLILESHGAREHDESILRVNVSKKDLFGSQLILTVRYAVQCGSSWNELVYDLFRLSPFTNRALPVLSGEHGIWFGAEDPLQIRLYPDNLLMEMRDRSIDGGIHNRAHILHFSVPANSPAIRVDPVALHPQDFVDEWLTRPWSEMESRSGTDESLKKWHDLLGGDLVFGEFTLAQACTDLPGKWQIGVDMRSIGGKDVPEPLSVYFQVQQLEQDRFRMNAVSFESQEGCPDKP